MINSFSLVKDNVIDSLRQMSLQRQSMFKVYTNNSVNSYLHSNQPRLSTPRSCCFFHQCCLLWAVMGKGSKTTLQGTNISHQKGSSEHHQKFKSNLWWDVLVFQEGSPFVSFQNISHQKEPHQSSPFCITLWYPFKMDVSKNRGLPKSSWNKVFPYKPSILGAPTYFWKHPYSDYCWWKKSCTSWGW